MSAQQVEGLHESSQHQKWRLAREWFTKRLPELRADLRALAPEIAELADRLDHVSTEDVLALSQRAKRAIVGIAVVKHCLERRELDDAYPDLDGYAVGNNHVVVSWTLYWSLDQQRCAKAEAVQSRSQAASRT